MGKGVSAQADAKVGQAVPTHGPRGSGNGAGKVEEDRVRAVQLNLSPFMIVHPVFHVSLIRPYTEDGQERQPGPLIFNADGSPQWEVEELLKVRHSRRGMRITEYLVRWRGFGPEITSWEPESSLVCTTRIDLYNSWVPGGAPRAQEVVDVPQPAQASTQVTL